jgi:hypothetical protein
MGDNKDNWDMLNERQQEMAEHLSELVTEFGMFDQTSYADGAHYAPAAKNPFKADGLICDNCIFHNEANKQCQIVAGPIENEAICKLWVIPENLIKGAQKPAQIEAKKTQLKLMLKTPGSSNAAIDALMQEIAD